jgi:arabinan endo-1,5-alpha-L-arabinosidase
MATGCHKTNLARHHELNVRHHHQCSIVQPVRSLVSRDWLRSCSGPPVLPCSRVLRFWFSEMIIAVLIVGAAPAQTLTGDLFVHDPSTILKEKDRYFLFSTGVGIATKLSSNHLHWTRGPSVFDLRPNWTTNVPGFRGYFWAPDVIRLNGKYALYYSVSSFGKQTSAIGLATNHALDPTAENFRWTDHGPIIESTNGSPFNAIDPALLLDRDAKLWMAFGSFWKGIYLVELDPRTGKRIAPDSPLFQIAYHEKIEAAALLRRADHYFVFVNWGTCCRGTNSTYEVRIGRSNKVTGPYLDRDGKDLVERGGTLFLASENSDIGPGHIAVLSDESREFVSYHVYDATQRGRSQLRIRPLKWTDDGWPIASQ